LTVSITQINSCRDKNPGQPLSITNNTDERIYYWYSYWKTEGYINYHYPDTLLPNEKPAYFSSVAPHNSSGTGGDVDPDWIKIFSDLSGGKFSVYFFDEPIETQQEWDVVRQTYDLFRKDVSYQELVDNNYSIDYP
jgi:hypothetical protein